MIKLDELMPDVAARIAEDAAKPPREDPGREAGRLITAVFLSADQDRAVARIPPAYAGADLSADWLRELVGEDAIERALCATDSARAAFLGPPGAGKTSLAAAMFRSAARADKSIKSLVRYRWVSSHKLAKARAGQPLGEGEAPLVEMCLEASLLVLDELGAEDPRYASAVAEVLYERHEQARRTWITTGVGPKEITARYGGGIARRVFEDAAVFRLAGRR